MSNTETERLIEALKAVLRAQNITYVRIAEALDVSEATVKRMFSRTQLTMDRFEAVCGIAGVTIGELAAMAGDRPEAITVLTPEQERELLNDDKLLLVAFMVLNGWTLEQITQTFEITEHEVIRRLAKLDRLRMIELLPGNRIRRLVARNFSWRKNGPVESFFESQVKQDFLDSRFTQPGEHLRFIGGLISRDSIRRMHGEIDALTAKLDEFIQRDLDLPMEDKLGIGAVFALRPWELPLFRSMRRSPNRKSFGP